MARGSQTACGRLGRDRQRRDTLGRRQKAQQQGTQARDRKQSSREQKAEWRRGKESRAADQTGHTWRGPESKPANWAGSRKRSGRPYRECSREQKAEQQIRQAAAGGGVESGAADHTRSTRLGAEGGAADQTEQGRPRGWEAQQGAES